MKYLKIALFIISSGTAKNVIEEYLVTDTIIHRYYKEFQKNKSPIDLYDGLILQNESGNQGLYFSLYTDYFRVKIVHFYQNNAIEDVYPELEIGPLKLENKLIKKHLDLLIKNSTPIPNKYFITKQNFKLGDTQMKATSIFGAPHKKIKNKNLEEWIWHYPGDIKIELEELSDTLFNVPGCVSYTHKILFEKNNARRIIVENEPP